MGLRHACAQCQAWREAYLPSLRVEVNIASNQLNRDDICSTLRRTLAETGLAPDGLGLGVTERILAADIKDTAQALHRLRRLGIRLSLDDFGTGFRH